MHHRHRIALLATCLAGQAHAIDPRSTIVALGAPHLLACEVRGALDNGPLRVLLPATPLDAQPRPLDIRWDAHGHGQTLRSLRVTCLYAPDPQTEPAQFVRVVGADDPFWRTVGRRALHPGPGRPLHLVVQPLSLQPEAGADGLGELHPALWGHTFREPLQHSGFGAAYLGHKARYVHIVPLLHAAAAWPQPADAADVPEPGDD